MSSVCRACGQPIRWLRRTDDGRNVAIDPAPHPNGRVVITAALGGPMADVRLFPPTGVKAHRFHSQTCTRRTT